MMSGTDENLSTLLNELKQLTSILISRLAFVNENELLDFIEQRGQLIGKMEKHRSFVTDQDRLILKELANMDPIILNKLNQFKEEAGKWLERQGNIRVQQSAYHQHFTNDSFFIDHRK